MKKNVSWSIGALIFLGTIALVFFQSPYGMTQPIVSTIEAQIEDTKGILNAIIENDQKIDECGFKWGTSPELTEETIILITNNTDNTYENFSTNLEGLEPGITYYYQAFAVNSKGRGYGDIKSFTIPVKENLPTVAMIENFDPIMGQASTSSKVAAVAPSKEAVEKATPQKNDQKHIVANKPKEIIPVSRSSQSTDIKKYPKLSKVNGSFGQFHYRDIDGGRIEIDPNWIANNIVTITLPGLNQKVQVHKSAADNFIKAFTLINNGTATINGKKVPLLSLIKTMDGTFVPRHVNWNSSKGLSNHSWGTAIDINAANHFRYVNPAKEPNNPNVILWEKAFKPAGFSWGNSYSDAMHYELLR